MSPDLTTTEHEDPVEKASRMIRVVDPNVTPEMVERALASLLCIEYASKSEMENQLVVAKVVRATGGKYGLLNPEPMRWRNKQGLPVLAPFHLHCQEISIEVRQRQDFHSRSYDDFRFDAPKSSRPYYQDMLRVLGSKVYRLQGRERIDYIKSTLTWFTIGSFTIAAILNTIIVGIGGIFAGWLNASWIFLLPSPIFWIIFGVSVLLITINSTSIFQPTRTESPKTIRATFAGLIPADVKREIQYAKGLGVFEEIFILAEVTDWKVEVSRQGDPLVVGFDGRNFWLIATFDTTTLERYVYDEFVTRA
jgi:hypothetical protein